MYMLDKMGVKTEVDLDRLCEASLIANNGLVRIPFSRYLQAWLAKQPQS